MSSADEWSLVLPWQPHSKKRPRISKPVKGKPPRTHQDPEDKAAEDRTRDYLQQHWGYPVQTGNLCLTVRFFRQSRQVVDADNLLKHLLDSGTGVIWVNDAQVTAFTVGLDLDRDNPRTEFWIEGHETSMERDYSSHLRLA